MSKKGAALEQLVALIQETLKDRPDAIVQTNVKLKDNIGVSREVDVLVSTQIQEFPIQIAFECKDYSKKTIDVQIIDALVGKYKYLPQIHRIIIVSTSGFTSSALSKAKQEGIELCSLESVSVETIFQNTEIYCPKPIFQFDNLTLNIDLSDNSTDNTIFDSYFCYRTSDDSFFDLELDIAEKLTSLEFKMKLVKQYMNNGRKPFVVSVTHIFNTSVYIKSVDGRKFNVTGARFTVHVDFVLEKGKAVKQQKIFQGKDVYITENTFNNSDVPFSAVIVESGEKYKAVFKIGDEYIDPSINMVI